MVSAQTWKELETEVNRVGSQPCMSMRWSSNKDSGYHVLGERPWLAILHACCPHRCWENEHCPWLSWEKTTGSSMGGTFLDSALATLSLADFNSYPFPVVNPNHEYKGFQWGLWALLANYQNWEWSYRSWNCSWCQRCGGLEDPPCSWC